MACVPLIGGGFLAEGLFLECIISQIGVPREPLDPRYYICVIVLLLFVAAPNYCAYDVKHNKTDRYSTCSTSSAFFLCLTSQLEPSS